MRIIRASEIGAFLFCQRAWWYQQRGEPSENQADLAGGTQLHEQHGQELVASGCLRSLAIAVILAALALLAYALTAQLL
jgi:hypothetical protein